MRIYIDTSVVGGFFDDEFAESTKQFFEKVESGEFTSSSRTYCRQNYYALLIGSRSYK